MGWLAMGAEGEKVPWGNTEPLSVSESQSYK